MASRRYKKSGSSAGSYLLGAFAVVAAGLCAAAVIAVSHLPTAPESPSPDKKIGAVAKQKEHVPPSAIRNAVLKTKKEVVTPATPLPEEEQIDVDGLTAHYQQRALNACLYAEKSGVLDNMRMVSDINGIHLEHMMTLAIFESNMGRLEQTDTVKDAKDRTSAVGITQITEGAFLEMLGRYGKDAVEGMARIDPEKSKELKYLLKFHKFNWKNSKVTLDYAAFNKAHKAKGEALKKRLLGLRVDKKIGKKLSVFLAFRDIEAKLPLLEKEIANNAPEHVQKLIKTYGSGFTFRLLHQWGLRGATKIVTTQNPNALMDGILGEQAAGQNNCKGQTVWDKLHEDAVKYATVSMTVHEYLKNPEAAALVKPLFPCKTKMAAPQFYQSVAKNG